MATASRVYLAARALRDLSKRSTQRDTFRHHRAVFAPPLSWRVSFKLLYSQRPLACLAAVFAYSFCTLAYLLHIAERDCNPIFEAYGNSCWLIIVTMTTVGYGDISPKDPFGRVIAAVACLWGIILLALGSGQSRTRAAASTPCAGLSPA